MLLSKKKKKKKLQKKSHSEPLFCMQAWPDCQSFRTSFIYLPANGHHSLFTFIKYFSRRRRRLRRGASRLCPGELSAQLTDVAVVPLRPRLHGSVTGKEQLSVPRVFHSHAKLDALIYGRTSRASAVALPSVTPLHVSLQVQLLYTFLFRFKEILTCLDVRQHVAGVILVANEADES